MYWSHRWRVEKRVAPTVTFINPADTPAGTVSAYAAATRSNATPLIDINTEAGFGAYVQLSGCSLVNFIAVANASF